MFQRHLKIWEFGLTVVLFKMRRLTDEASCFMRRFHGCDLIKSSGSGSRFRPSPR